MSLQQFKDDFSKSLYSMTVKEANEKGICMGNRHFRSVIPKQAEKNSGSPGCVNCVGMECSMKKRIGKNE